MSSPRLRIGMVGAGNLAWNLALTLKGSPYAVVQILSRTQTHAIALAEACGAEDAGADPSTLRQDLDLVIISSSDHVIGGIATTYAPFKAAKTAFVHTSGAAPLSLLAPLGDRIGVLYPLQTFTRDHRADFSKVPFFLEGNAEVAGLLRPLAESLSGEVHELDSEGRLQLHLGAVFASNFANFMWILAEETLQGLQGLDLKVYAPLVRECVEKAFRYGPLAAQTGPARRGDQVTMDKHLAILAAQNPAREALYRLLSGMIQDRFPQ